MTERLHLSSRHRTVLVSLLQEHLPGVEVWAYGSRVNGRSHDGSDLDLVLRGPGLTEIPTGQLADFEEAVGESSIPFLVEARDWARLPERFHGEIERDYVVLDAGKPDTTHIVEGVGDGTPPQSPQSCGSSGVAGEWTIMDLGSVIDLLTGFPFKSSRYIDNPNAIRLLRGDNIAQGVLRWDGVKRWPHNALEKVSLYKLQEGDVIIAMDRPWIDAGLKYAVVRQSDLPALLVQRVARLRGTENLETAFLKYVIGSKAFTDYVLAVQTGTAVPHISGSQIKGYKFALPPLSEQRAIARILGVLDDKIEVNRRMNATLEAMARAVFRDWFVDFGPARARMEGREPYLAPETWNLFPDKIDDEGKPDGWKWTSLATVADSPRRSVSPADVAENTPYIGLEHMPRRSIALLNWEGAGKVASNKSVFRKGELLFGKLRPYFHKVGFAALDGICSTDIVVVTPQTPEWAAFTLACLSSDEFVNYTNQTSTGTKMPRTSWNTMRQYRFCLPSEQVAHDFQRLIQPLIDRINVNIHESRTLTKTRGLLLPKLISGELKTNIFSGLLEVEK